MGPCYMFVKKKGKHVTYAKQMLTLKKSYQHKMLKYVHVMTFYEGLQCICTGVLCWEVLSLQQAARTTRQTVSLQNMLEMKITESHINSVIWWTVHIILKTGAPKVKYITHNDGTTCRLLKLSLEKLFMSWLYDSYSCFMNLLFP